MTKGVILFSGGLDSILAAKLLMEQDIDLYGFHCVSPFVSIDQDLEKSEAGLAAAQIGLQLNHYRLGKDYLDMVKNPQHGYGKQMNPCIDCKIFFLKKATEYMKELGADFVATGEVVGQRPMSQLKHTLNHIRKTTELDGRLLRPLSAKILEPTIVENEGLVDREALLDINGRGRTRQMELAEKFGISEYSSPAGGCHFTDRFIANRVKDLFKYHEEYDTTDFYLLTVGRHFRLSDNVKAIVGRNHSENIALEDSLNGRVLAKPLFMGPSATVYGTPNEDELKDIASLIVRYSREESGDVEFSFPDGEKVVLNSVEAIAEEKIDVLRV